ncbi:MAG: glycosyltransferase [Muribaculum sp.]|nr:glycosyltransferase [Muribaculaceae bacterium]MCM1081380.1 glycosyltransferase [Muribaculum sp.]
MDISVIVATYNQEDTIGRTLESILCQNCTVSFEIIVADDCSTDSTEAVCLRYVEQNPGTIRYIRRVKNMGVASNYFDAIRQATGRFIADCAGDDFWVDSNKLQRQFDILNENTDITLVHTGWQCFNPTTNCVSPSYISPSSYPQLFSPVTDGKKLLTPIVSHNPNPLIHLCTAMYRRDIVMSAMENYPELFESQWLTCEDLQLSAITASAGKIAFLPQITLNYTVTENTISKQTSAEKAFVFYYGIYKLVLELQRILNIPFTDLSSYYRDSFKHLAKLMFNSRNPHLRRQLLLLPYCDKMNISILLSANNYSWNCAYKIKKLLKRGIK